MRLCCSAKKLALPLLLSLTSVAAQANDVNDPDAAVRGFAILGGVSNIGGDMGKGLTEMGLKDSIPSVSMSYTWGNGIGLGGSLTQLQNRQFYFNGNLVEENDIGFYNLYAAYTFPINLKLMAGVGVAYDKDEIKDKMETGSGLMVGLGYTLPFGLSMEVHYSENKIFDIKGDQTSFLLGYKW